MAKTKTTATRTSGDQERAGSCCSFERLFTDLCEDPHRKKARDKARSGPADLLRAVRAIPDWGIEHIDPEPSAHSALHRAKVG